MNDTTQRNVILWLNRLGPMLALVCVFLFFAWWAPPTFRSTDNVELMLRQTAVVGTLAIGMTIVIISAGIDLSVGSLVALTSVVLAVMLRNGYDPIIAIVAAVLVGALAGFMNGLVITQLKVVPFIVTLGTLLIFRGTAKWAANNVTVSPPRTWLTHLLQSAPGEIPANTFVDYIVMPARFVMRFPPGVWVMVVLAALAILMLYYTRFGRHIFAVGSNEQTARLCGIAVQRVKMMVYVIVGAAAGVSGVMAFSRLNSGDPTGAVSMELDAIAAVVIGGASLSGGQGSIVGSIAGALLMTVIKSGCTQVGLDNYVQEIVTGVIIIVAVMLDQLRHRKLS